MRQHFTVLRLILVTVFTALICTLAFTYADLSSATTASSPTQKLINEITKHSQAHENLRELTSMGPRLSGSVGAENAVIWAKAKLESYGFDKVWLQPMQAPRWTRGDREEARAITADGELVLQVAALGGSVGTPTRGLQAAVIEVQSLAQVEALGRAQIQGKIVFYNRAMANIENKFAAYGQAVDQRSSGPAKAAQFGAVAVLVRSMTTLIDDEHPHTGITVYNPRFAKIPAAALSTKSARLLSEKLTAQPNLKVHLTLSAENHSAVTSYNVIAEMTGRELPEEYVVIGGHLDSWDLSEGAHDDGAGTVQSIEALRALKQLQLRPKRTIRVVLFMSEEFGGYGGEEYALQAKKKNERHVGAIESDAGGAMPTGISVDANDMVLQKAQTWAPFLSPLHADVIEAGGSGTDVEPLNDLGCATFGLDVDSTHYFDYHHSALDVFTAIDKTALDAGAATMAVWAYLMAEEGFEN